MSEHRDHITISLYNITEVSVFGWWSIFGARDQHLRIVDHRGGYIVPDIRLSFDGAAFEIWSEQRTYLNPAIRFWTGPSEVMTRLEAETCLSELIGLVLDRLQTHGVPDSNAALRWHRVNASRKDPDEASFCECAGALGVDPYAINESLAADIERAAILFDGEPLTEFLAGARTSRKTPLIEWVEQVENRPTDASRIADLQQISNQIATKTPDRSGDPPWATGYRRARKLRETLNFSETRRFSNFEELTKAVGASPSYALTPPAYGIRLLRTNIRDDVHLHTRPHGKSAEAHAAQIFTFARGIGDVTCFPTPQRAPVNDLRLAYRQAASRAFAAEFLAPVNEIMSMQEDGLDTLAIADEFAVSVEVIERQLENSARINTACD